MADKESEIVRELQALRREVAALRRSVHAMKRAKRLEEKRRTEEQGQDDDQRTLRDLSVDEMYELVERVAVLHLENAIKNEPWFRGDTTLKIAAAVDNLKKPSPFGMPRIRFGFSYNSAEKLRMVTAYWARFSSVVEIGNVNVRPFSVHKRVHERLEADDFMKTLAEAVKGVGGKGEVVDVEVVTSADGPLPYRLCVDVNVFNARERERNEGQ
jgi:hypothetical protein